MDESKMKKEDIIHMAREAGLTPEIYAHPGVKQLIAMVQASAEKYYMQLFLDPENQPTQFGTATKEYRSAEIAAEREACAKEVWPELKVWSEEELQAMTGAFNRAQEKHGWYETLMAVGASVLKMKAAAIRARGQA
jgi:hypothetical protein